MRPQGAPIAHRRYDVGPLGMPAPVTRLRSVDAFRGLTMAGMVIVNNPGDWNTVYAPLLHAEWHGWTPTDLIFPWFLVIDGRGDGPGRTRARAVAGGAAARRRSSSASGCSCRASRTSIRPAGAFPGVLVRIGLCYLRRERWSGAALARPSDPDARRFGGWPPPSPRSCWATGRC